MNTPPLRNVGCSGLYRRQFDNTGGFRGSQPGIWYQDSTHGSGGSCSHPKKSATPRCPGLEHQNNGDTGPSSSLPQVLTVTDGSKLGPMTKAPHIRHLYTFLMTPHRWHGSSVTRRGLTLTT